MLNYVIRRLLLLPLTLFCILLINFVVINLAPGDPLLTGSVDKMDAARKAGQESSSQEEEQYLQFREYYGLTLPIVFNTWPSLAKEDIEKRVYQIANRKYAPGDPKEISVKVLHEMTLLIGDQARFVMPYLIDIAQDDKKSFLERQLAVRLFVRGGTKQAVLGPRLSSEERAYNRTTAKDNVFLHHHLIATNDDVAVIAQKVLALKEWYNAAPVDNPVGMPFSEKMRICLRDTRLFTYMSRVLMLDFGTVRGDANKTVISEVSKRFKYSLTLSIIPMLITFVFCQVLGFIMAIWHNRSPDWMLNVICLILYATPVFVIAPLLIEGIALHHNIPFTHTPFPYSGFNSPDPIFLQMTSSERLYDIATHIALPLIAVIYGSLAVQSRISRTAVLEVLRQDYVRTARAKGLSPFVVLWKHVGRNAGITIVTSIAGSLGIVLGGSLIVETIFEIDGFGRFFYDAAVNRDYNVIMFSALAGAALTLLGYLVADIAYTFLDPRVTLD